MIVAHMRTKSKRVGTIRRKNPAFDLFGDVPVLLSDVELWCLNVAGVQPGSWRYDWYVINWHVVDKIKQSKLDGTFPPPSSCTPSALLRTGSTIY